MIRECREQKDASKIDLKEIKNRILILENKKFIKQVDYKNKISLTPGASGSKYTIPSDGCLIITANSNVSLIKNGVEVFRYNGKNLQVFQEYVSKGDVVVINYQYQIQSIELFYSLD